MWKFKGAIFTAKFSLRKNRFYPKHRQKQLHVRTSRNNNILSNRTVYHVPSHFPSYRDQWQRFLISLGTHSDSIRYRFAVVIAVSCVFFIIIKNICKTDIWLLFYASHDARESSDDDDSFSCPAAGKWQNEKYALLWLWNISRTLHDLYSPYVGFCTLC